jgi:ABC-type tungstate transport system substrate-binding protein
MSMLPSITGSGLALVERADRRLAESAHAFTQSAESVDAPASAETSSAEGNGDADVVDAAVGVVYGRTAFEIGIALIAVGRDTEKSLVDVLA